MIGVQVIRNLHEAKNMGLRVEFMIQDRRRFESLRRNYGSDNSGAPIDEGLTVQELQPFKDRYKEEKASGKSKVVDNKDTPKTTNPNTRPTPIQCFKCNLLGHRSSDRPLRKAVHLVEREEEGVISKPDGEGEEQDDHEEGNERLNYVVRTLMGIQMQEEKSENMSSPTFPIIAHSE